MGKFARKFGVERSLVNLSDKRRTAAPGIKIPEPLRLSQSWFDLEAGPCPESVTFPEMRRLNAERPQINIALAAMMNFVVDGVLNGRQPRPFPPAKRLVHFAEP